jgi:hypothetical protein
MILLAVLYTTPLSSVQQCIVESRVDLRLSRCAYALCVRARRSTNPTVLDRLS